MSKLLALCTRRILFPLMTVGMACFALLHRDVQMARVEEEDADDIRGYFEYRFDQMKDASGTIPDGAQMEALTQRAAMAQQQAQAPLAADSDAVAAVAGIDNTSWTAVGPGNVGGRVRAILPIDASTVFIGGVAGGLWKTTNCCSTSTTWAPINDFLANLAISSLIVDPTNSNVMYAGTGEGFGNWDAIRGAGVFTSTDGGSTWAQLASTNTSNWYYVNRLAISSDGTTLLAATGTGLWRSTNGGASWTQLRTGSWKDVKFDPSNSNNAVAAADGFPIWIYGGATSASATGLPSAGRIELAYAPSNTSIVYASVDQNSGTLYKSTNGGYSYSQVNTGTGYFGQPVSQGWYDNMIWVDPADATHVVVGGIDLYESTDGGTTLTQISNWYTSWYFNPASPSPHADHHAMVSVPPGSSTSVINGNDGGLYYTSAISTAGNNPPNYNNGWVYLNNQLGITQFYGASGNATSGVVYGGTQDNGTIRYTTAGGASAWTGAAEGDGGKSAADPTDSNYFFGEYVNAQIHRSSDGGVSASYIYNTAGCSITDAGSNTTALFISPLVLDPNNSGTLYVGAANLWKSTNVKGAGPCWEMAKPSVASTLVSAIAVAPGDSNITWVGYTNSRIDMTTDGGSTWTEVDTNIGTDNPGTQVGTIAIDKDDNTVVYVGFTGFGPNRVWRTANGGASWTNITSNLPQAPVYALAINPANSAWLYVGTEIGIFASTDTGTTWNVPAGPDNGDGPANVATFDLQWMSGGNSTGTTTLIAATHGRGAFTTETLAALVPPNSGTDSCEDTVAGNIKTLAVCTANCQTKEADYALRSRVFDEMACEQGTDKPTSCRAAYDKAEAAVLARTTTVNKKKQPICPNCLGATAQNGLADSAMSVVEQLDGQIYCAGTTGFASGNPGFVPPDRNTGACEDTVSRNLRTLAGCITSCQRKEADAARKSKSFDVQACEGTSTPTSCLAAYDKARAAVLAKTATVNKQQVAICPSCLGATAQDALADAMISFIDQTNGAQIYCAGTTPLP